MINHEAVILAFRNRLLTLSVAATTAFSRASVARYTDINGVVQAAAVDVLRDAHYVNGVLQSPLIESAGENLVLQSTSLLTASGWFRNSGSETITGGLTDSAGGTTGTNVAVVTTAGALYRAITFTADATKAVSVDVKQGSVAVQDVQLWDNTAPAGRHRVRVTWSGGIPTAATQTGSGTVFPMRQLANGWWRLEFSAAGVIAANANQLYLYGDPIGGAGNSSFACPQAENATTPSSYIPTTTATATRAADVDAMLAASATGYTRTTGSFLTEGFAVGMEFTPAGFATNAVHVIAAVTATTITTADTIAVESAVPGRSLAVTLPALRGYDNVAVTPVAGRPYIEEELVPAGSVLLTQVSLGTVEHTGLYVLRWYGLADQTSRAVSACVDGVLALFPPGYAWSLANGDHLKVRGDIAPFRSAIQADAPGWAVATITVPYRLHTLNPA